MYIMIVLRCCIIFSTFHTIYDNTIDKNIYRHIFSIEAKTVATWTLVFLFLGQTQMITDKYIDKFTQIAYSNTNKYKDKRKWGRFNHINSLLSCSVTSAEGAR